MNADSRQARSIWLAAVLSGLTLVLVAYWSLGPHELAPWRIDAMSGDFNKGASALKHTGRSVPTEPQLGYVDKPTLPAMVQATLTDMRRRTIRLDSEPAEPAEHLFTRFLAFDALAAAVLAFALLGWRREHAAAGLLARTLALFGFALACFLINGQSRLRGGPFVWPGWPRLATDVAATLAFGLSLLGLERFFSVFPVRLEDWHVLHTLRLRSREEPGKRGRTNLLSLARLVPKAVTGVLLFGTVASTLPQVLFDLRYPLDAKPDGAVMELPERLGLGSMVTGLLASQTALVLIMAFGWLLSASLAARLRAAREHCTEEERRQADWLFAGGLTVALMIALFSLGLLALLLFLAWGPGSEWAKAYLGSAAMLFFPAGWAVMLFALAGAVFLSKAFGPRPLLKRTALIAAVGIVMSFLIAVVQHTVVTKLLGQLSASAQHGVSTAVSGGVVMFAFGFFRQRFETGVGNWLDRFMPATVIADGKRRDATVVFSDLGGYTALSAADEAKALHVAGHFQKTAAAVARRHSGRIVKTIGDAVMWLFATPAEAFAAALALPAEFQSAVDADQLPALPVNSGCIMVRWSRRPGAMSTARR